MFLTFVKSQRALYVSNFASLRRKLLTLQRHRLLMTMTYLDVKYGSQGFDSAVLWLVGCVALGKSFFLKLLDPHG